MLVRSAGLVTITIVILTACSTSQFGWKAEGDSASKSKYIEDFDPLSLEDDDIVIGPTGRASSSDDEDVSLLSPSDSRAGESEPEMIPGFRVQLLATGDELQAREAKRDAIFKFQVGVYLVFEAPMYKLRIGDCRTRKEAEALRGQAVRSGFRDAWIVPSKIMAKQEGDLPY